MRQRRTRTILALFMLLSAGLAANLLLMQKGKSGSGAGRIAAERAGRLALERTGEQAVPPAQTPPERAAPSPAAPAQVTPVAHSGAAAPAKPGTRAAVAAAPPAASAQQAPVVSAEGGDASGVIRAVQRELQARGYDLGQADGQPGLLTRAAVMAYEHDHGMALTAEPSDAFLKAMIFGAAGRPGAGGAKPRTAQAEQLVRTVQQMLSALNYNTGRADGMLGDDTVRAIREFESDQRLPVSGRVSGTLLARLAKVAGSSRLTSGR